jgi:hypothetical protein
MQNANTANLTFLKVWQENSLDQKYVAFESYAVFEYTELESVKRTPHIAVISCILYTGISILNACIFKIFENKIEK